MDQRIFTRIWHGLIVHVLQQFFGCNCLFSQALAKLLQLSFAFLRASEAACTACIRHDVSSVIRTKEIHGDLVIVAYRLAHLEVLKLFVGKYHNELTDLDSSGENDLSKLSYRARSITPESAGQSWVSIMPLFFLKIRAQ